MSPRTNKQNAEIRQKMEQLILESALSLFAESSFIGTPMSAIANKSGVSKGNLYNYFKSKKDLLKGVLLYGLDQFSDFFDSSSAALITEKEFEVSVRGNFEMIKNNKVYWKLYYNLFAQKEVQKMFTEIFAPFLDQYIQLFESYYTNKGDKNPKATALLLGSSLDGISLGYLMMGDKYPLDEVVDQLILKFK